MSNAAYVQGFQDGRNSPEVRAMLAALHESAMANERAFHDLAVYAGVDTVNPEAWFRLKQSSLSEAIRMSRAAIAQAEAAGIKADDDGPIDPRSFVPVQP